MYLSKAIRLIETQIDFARWKIKHVIPAHKNRLQWTGSIIEWVELIYALYTIKRINNGEITLKALFQQMGEIFDFDVKEFSNYFMNIKNRTDGHRTKFLDRLRATLLERIEDSDRKPSQK
jgi:hypothetical protein